MEICYYKTTGEDAVVGLRDGKIVAISWGVPRDRRQQWIDDIRSGDVQDYIQFDADDYLDDPMDPDEWAIRNNGTLLACTD